ncbi:hypothetical protein N7510_003603 [Penicillium lagena]|uniref:uncharacterized protein n=1 Tax=Penicillium lagena TaxID=94218 RepID=UPI00253F6840|nr:uncharacterized protein N7510_003603 [Penicillium lagena]KAJ5619619.1 hypothetical protein N7510_003603 [Penicillium lagena]
MSSPNVYCPLCGVILLSNTYTDDTRVRPWYAQVRGIYSTNAAVGDPITTTGVGLVRYRNKLYAPLDSDRSYFDVGNEPLEEWKLCQSSDRWCFGLHDSCWSLLLLRLRHFQDKAVIAKSVFYQLYCTPCLYASTFQFGHDYEGAAQTHEPFGRPAVNRMSQFYADPYEIPHHLEDFGRFKPYVLYSGDPTEERREKLERDVFNELSPELKFEILSYLSFDEILNMRLVCRDLAQLAAVESLPLSYWRSRFLLGQEFDFLFPNLSDTQNWFGLFFGTRAFLRAGYTELVNRKRIRQLLEPIAALVELEATLCKGPYGSAFHPTQSQGSYFQLIDEETTENPPQFIEIAGSFSGQLASTTANSLLKEGCRVLYHRAQSLMAPCQEHRQRIGISIVKIGARGFISGINLFPSGEHNDVDRLVGYRIPASEVWIDIPSTVKSLCVAFCSEGLTGIKFAFTNSDSSGWIGSSSGPGIAYGTIDIPNKLEQCRLLAGLDRYKIVSLGLGELTLTPRSGTSPKLHSQDAMDSLCVQSYLWTSHLPGHDGLRISPLLPYKSSRAFEPLTNIDFGGPRGLFLRSLTMFTFYMASGPYPITGIEISYSDRRPMLFGSKDGCGLSFFLDGSKGERINRVGILEDNRCDSIGLGGLQVFLQNPQVSVWVTKFDLDLNKL